jgi:hypothetical protein
MKILSIHKTEGEARTVLDTLGFRPWSDRLDARIFFRPETFEFTKIHFALNAWRIEKPTQPEPHEKEKV